MLIAIISDTHDNIPNIEKFLSWAQDQKIKMIVHCGDIAAPGVVKKLFSQFAGEIHLVYGNVSDRELLPRICAEFPLIKLHGDQGSVIIPPPTESQNNSLKIAFCHFPEQAKELAETGRYDLVFYGHTHKPWMETLSNGCQMINPGTLGGIFNKATFAVFDTETKKLELKVLELL